MRRTAGRAGGWRLGSALAFICAGLAAAVFSIGCNSSPSSPSQTTPSQATPVAQENNPAGDIPDNQVFVTYHSAAGGYGLQAPEGWARTESGSNVNFADKFNGVAVEVTASAAPPTVDSVTANELPLLRQQVEAFEQIEVKTVDLPAGTAVLVRYRANSAADAVTGKRARLEVDRYEFFKDGKMAALSLSAPSGSDNVDVWNQIAGSFTWG